MIYDTIVVGGGASGFFSALNLAKARPDLSVLILERGAQVLEKVRVSGGGRCNVTHAVFEPRPLTENYPRGSKELLGPFHKYMTGDTMGWFEDLGIPLKIEADGRVFPQSDSSQTVIDCFLEQAQKYNVSVLLKKPVVAIDTDSEVWTVSTKSEQFKARTVIMATGSNPKVLQMLALKGIAVIPAVPSLFTFNINDKRIEDLAGLSTMASVRVWDLNMSPVKFSNSGASTESTSAPVLITHWGLSGPGILKLSAWGARSLHKLDYQFFIQVNWLPQFEDAEVLSQLKEFKFKLAKQHVSKWSPFDLPKRLWKNLVNASGVHKECKWADATAAEILNLKKELCEGIFRVSGKSTFKDEFVTAGGIDLKEIDFKTFASKKFDGLYSIGEILNIDAITGGFNFQNAWTGGFIAAQAIAQKL